MSQWEEVGSADLKRRVYIIPEQTFVCVRVCVCSLGENVEGTEASPLPQVVERLMPRVVAGCVADGRSTVAPSPAEVKTPHAMR